MSRILKHAIAEEFNKLDFHDDALVSVRIRAPRRRKNLTKIDFQFRDDGTKAIKTLSFQELTNYHPFNHLYNSSGVKCTSPGFDLQCHSVVLSADTVRVYFCYAG
jgi:hypothetical protein